MRRWWKQPRPWHRHPNDPDGDDMPETQCDGCDGWFPWDPYDHLDSDGESVFATPPSLCSPCEEREAEA